MSAEVRPVDIKYCRKRLAEMSIEDGNPLPPEHPWFWCSYPGNEGSYFDETAKVPTGNTDLELSELIRNAGESEGYDISTSEGLEATLKVMYYG